MLFYLHMNGNLCLLYFNLKIMYVQFITHWYKQNIEEKNAC